MKEIQTILQKDERFLDCSVHLKKKGYSHATFIVTARDGRRWVAKQGFVHKDSGSSLTKQVLILQFLKAQKIPFVPEVVYWDPVADVSIETYVGAEDIESKKLDRRMLDVLIDQLHAIHKVPCNSLINAATEARISLVLPPLASLQIYGFERFEIVERFCPDKGVVEWLKNGLEQMRQAISKQKPGKLHLQWGDIGNNVRQSGKGLFFIDWEHARVGHGSELAYIKVHSGFTDTQFAHLIRRYAQVSGVDNGRLLEEVAQDERTIRLNDVVWAAMKWGQASSASEAAEFQALTHLRQQRAQALFA